MYPDCKTTLNQSALLGFSKNIGHDQIWYENSVVFNDCWLHCGFLSENFYFYGTSFLITVIKKDIILVSRTLDPSFIHFYRENINQTVTCRITHAAKAYYDKLIPGPGGGVTQIWVGYGCPAQNFNHHSITKPEKTKICNLCLNHLFLDHVERPFFLKQIGAFYHVNWDA